MLIVGSAWVLTVMWYPGLLKRVFRKQVKTKDLDKFKPSNNGQHQKQA